MKQIRLEEALHLAIDEARTTMNKNIGRPFGAAVISPEGEALSIASNTVLRDQDPTAHAEINAICKAGAKLKTHDLKGCILVTTAFPCSMCCSAIIGRILLKCIMGLLLRMRRILGFEIILYIPI